MAAVARALVIAVGLAAALILAFSALWGAGERHRENCIRLDRIGCSVLPWKDGREKPPSGSGGGLDDFR